MTAYYPSQAGYATTQPGVVYASTAGYGQPAYGNGMAGSYAQPGGVMYVPSYGSSPRHRRRRHHYYNDYRVPQVAAIGAPVMVQPSYGHGGHAYGHHQNHFSFGARLRRFFGLAPSTGIRYKHDHGTWGFMGYSRRQRYTDMRTGMEVDRQGRPVYRV